MKGCGQFEAPSANLSPHYTAPARTSFLSISKSHLKEAFQRPSKKLAVGVHPRLGSCVLAIAATGLPAGKGDAVYLEYLVFHQVHIGGTRDTPEIPTESGTM